MSQFPGSTLEEFLADWYHISVVGVNDPSKTRVCLPKEQFSEIVILFEERRHLVEHWLSEFYNQDEMGWSNYCIFGPSDVWLNDEVDLKVTNYIASIHKQVGVGRIMDTVTVEQVQKAVYDNNIKSYHDPILCTECGRGTRYYFHRSDKFTLNILHIQRGCDCDWVPSAEMSYDDFVAMLNEMSPEDRKLTWDNILASGKPDLTKIKNTLPDETKSEDVPKEPIVLVPISEIMKNIEREFPNNTATTS